MDIYSVRMHLRTTSIYAIPLRVTYYARVSSESDEQINSLGNQISYYEEYIRKNKAWTFVSGYIDEGISGISTKKRENFNRMISDAKNGKFDLIITKEISRFARNTLDSLKYTRELLNDGVCVFFQNDNINTVDEDSELRLSIMSSIAQEELRKLSSRVKFGHQQAIKKNVVLGNSKIFGYVKNNKHLVIDEKEAEMVRELFELYATDEYSMKQIETVFWEKGYRNHNGNKIAHTTMSGIISNPKYKGYYVGNKVKVIDMFSKKQKFLPRDEWVMFKDETGEIVPAIVSEELWDKANVILARRSEDVKSRQGTCNHANLMTGKLFCSECGLPYYRRESKSRDGKENSKWICSGKIKNGYDSCPSLPIYEDEIKPILFEVFSDTEVDVEALIAKYTQMYAELESENDIQKHIDEQNNKIDMAIRKKSKLIELNVEGKIDDKDFVRLSREIDSDKKKAEELLVDYEKQLMSNEEFRMQMNKIRTTLAKARDEASDGMITKEFVNRYIDRIIVTPKDNGEVLLNIKIFTGKECDKYLRKLEGRTGHITADLSEPPESADKTGTFETSDSMGHTSKKMVESYENSVSAK